MMMREDRIHDAPRCFNRVLTGEKCPVTLHSVAQEALVRRFLPWLLFRQVKLSLLSYKLLPREFHASCKRDS
jgi:hypothetical protein